MMLSGLFHRRNTELWIRSYIKSLLFNQRRALGSENLHLYFMIADHFEPFCGNAGRDVALRRVRRWCDSYQKMLSPFRDSEGRTPKHTFFFPEEEYDPFVLHLLSSICREGGGDVEIHLHHDGDSSTRLKEKLIRFKRQLHEKHGLLRTDQKTGEIIYGFIHGNWALDNSRRDGKWCGVNDELRVLGETGCYADFTLPSAPSDTQTAKINSIYYATDDVDRPKSHNDGVDVEKGRKPCGDLMLIQGPLTLNWKRRKWGFLPRIENGDLSHDARMRPERIEMWVHNAPSVVGIHDCRFLKIYTHGCNDQNLRYLLDDGGLKTLYSLLIEFCDREKISLHFVTAYEMYKIIKKLEEAGD